MAEGQFIAYYRVSTKRQEQSGLGLEAQRTAVHDWLDGGNWELVAEYTETESGKVRERPQLQAALAHCRRVKATLVIAKLDRLARNVAFTSALMESGVEFIAVDMPHASKLTIHILAAVAEHEREMISKRTRDALQAAKARGVKLGGPNLAQARAQSLETRTAKADQFAANVVPIIREIEASGVTTLRKVAAALNARGITTRRGGEWAASQVRAAMHRVVMAR